MEFKYLGLFTPFIAGFVAWKIMGRAEMALFVMVGGLIINSYLIFFHKKK